MSKIPHLVTNDFSYKCFRNRVNNATQFPIKFSFQTELLCDSRISLNPTFNMDKTWGQFNKNISPIPHKTLLTKKDTLPPTHVFKTTLLIQKKKKQFQVHFVYFLQDHISSSFFLFSFYFYSIKTYQFLFQFLLLKSPFLYFEFEEEKKKSYYKTITITSHLYSLNLVTTAYPYLNTPHFNSNSNKNNFKNLELHQYIFISTSFLLILFNFEKNSAGTHQNDALLERR